MAFNALIVDDEVLARQGLRSLLERDPGLGDVQEARDGAEAVIAIRARRPDVVFLDVQMPELDAFGVVEAIGPDAMPPVVFVTAFDVHAIRAFDISAIDYLLKPVTTQRFDRALARVKAHLTPSNAWTAQMLTLLQAAAVPPHYPERIAIRSAGVTTFVAVADVDWIRAAENYVELHTARTMRLAHLRLSALERALEPARFLRIHRSVIVNVTRIVELRPTTHGEFDVVLASGVRLRSSRTFHAGLKALTVDWR